MITSKDIRVLIDNLSKIFATKFDLQQLMDELQEETRNLRLDVLEKLDTVFKEV